MIPNSKTFDQSRRRQFYPKADIEIADEHLSGMKSRERRVRIPDARAALESMGVSVGSLRLLTTGTFHELFVGVQEDGKHWVLKANRAPELIVDLALETEMLVSRALLAHDVGHAEILVVDCSRKVVNFDFQLMEYLQGESFRAFDGSEQVVERNLPHLAGYLRHCHEIGGAGFGLLSNEPEAGTHLVGVHKTWADYLDRQVDRHIRIVKDSGLISQRDSATVRSVLADLANFTVTVAPRLLHGDCGPQNVIVDPNGNIAMIDWEDAVLGDPLFEVALWATFNPPRRWRTFFASYFEVGWEPDFLFWAYFLRISLAKTVVRLRFEYGDAPGREPASSRIQLALDSLAKL